MMRRWFPVVLAIAVTVPMAANAEDETLGFSASFASEAEDNGNTIQIVADSTNNDHTITTQSTEAPGATPSYLLIELYDTDDPDPELHTATGQLHIGDKVYYLQGVWKETAPGSGHFQILWTAAADSELDGKGGGATEVVLTPLTPSPGKYLAKGALQGAVKDEESPTTTTTFVLPTSVPPTGVPATTGIGNLVLITAVVGSGIGMAVCRRRSDSQRA